MGIGVDHLPHAVARLLGEVADVDVHDEVVDAELLILLEPVDHLGGLADDDRALELLHCLVGRQVPDGAALDDAGAGENVVEAATVVVGEFELGPGVGLVPGDTADPRERQPQMLAGFAEARLAAGEGAELTLAGFKFKRYAEVMVQLWRQARYEVSLPKGFEGVCNVGLEFDLWPGLGQRFLEHVRQAAPGMAIAVWPGAGPDLDPSYIFVDHGEAFRRLHAEAFAGEAPPAVTIASSDWATCLLLGRGGSDYLPLRVAEGLIAEARLHVAAGAPVFVRRVYVVENAQTVKAWGWYAACLAALDRG
ncbi:MAG: hypothetical protein HY245_10265 [Rhizobiales bacterium]|nr:hypothetical protein [Hyphomicrobiales bacterium]MBI3673783.1 hypothetical protein [Hyphomicrobiales bacterium]